MKRLETDVEKINFIIMKLEKLENLEFIDDDEISAERLAVKILKKNLSKTNPDSKYKKLIEKVYEQYLGDIRSDDLNNYFKKWAKKNNFPLPKHIRFLKDMAYNCEGDIVPIVQETDGEVYYNDSCHRYCYLNKSDEGTDFEYC